MNSEKGFRVKGKGSSSGEYINCPRCNNRGRLIEKRTPHNTYYYVYHSKKKICYLGAGRYEYVSKLHDFELRGAHDTRRYVDYLEFIIETLAELNYSRATDEIIKAIAEGYVRITELLVELVKDPMIDDSVREQIANAIARAIEIAKTEVSKK